MARVWKRAHWLVCSSLALVACGREAVGSEPLCHGILPGDLVITEVHANPDGADADGEYIELYNAGGTRAPLDGVTLAASRTDGASPRMHRFATAAEIDAGDYFVVGNAEGEVMPDYLDYTYGDSLGSLRNTDGLLSLWCGEQLLDEVAYAETADGRATELDGRFVPDDELNDDPASWCTAPEGAVEVTPGNFGTPGSPNSDCAASPTEGFCLSGDSVRAVRPPAPGDLRITEWMANPAGPDADFEWVEVAFDADVDLNGFHLGPAPHAMNAVVEGEECFAVDAGTRLVFGGSPAAAPRVDAKLGFSLGNSGARSIVAGHGGTILHRLDYETTTEGFAWQTDRDQKVCLALPTDEYAEGNFGTPGAENRPCPIELGPGECFDERVPRPVVSPAPGQALITEWMANPSAVGNREGEWVEVRLDADLDLNGLTLSDRVGGTTLLEDEQCLRVAAGTHLVLARSTDPLVNGGIEDVDGELSLSLNNGDETITLRVGDEVLDSVAYERSEPGVATQIDELGRICAAVRPYGEGDLGTPGSANPPCP
ncbi:MAG: hypothetical protein AMJ62_06915 [Myxococcales bacterium SG8_38]|nr:MAG: hypothetical protein AMJ62_06915 [Myxococcales bacterium SG8_38]